MTLLQLFYRRRFVAIGHKQINLVEAKIEIHISKLAKKDLRVRVKNELSSLESN